MWCGKLRLQLHLRLRLIAFSVSLWWICCGWLTVRLWLWLRFTVLRWVCCVLVDLTLLWLWLVAVGYDFGYFFR